MPDIAFGLAKRMNLEDDALVLRGGIPDENRWLQAVLDALDEGSQPVLSVFANNYDTGENETQLIRRIAMNADIKHGKVAVTTAGRIRALGLRLEHDPTQGQSENHFHVVFATAPSKIMVRDLIRIFSVPFPNPRR